ncbi:hypothetical protein [Vibrio tapetis]|uniref:ABM domain-containing protein n=1 Tax=Vibrio tapetis subsp. tapetis TaxID=1671868 RepID=A0A2N8ZJ75_9VIBR|nr:hypothetical protein [Vibrio tapetis]SON51968.1 conserved protein of unknown function [Vibrio tapetis subsp. tapetis]
MQQVIEIVSYKANENVSEQDMIAASEQSHKFIASLPGFLYRSVSHNPETQSWTDVVYWRNLDDAKSAGEQFMQSADCQPLVALISQESLSMQHQFIKMSGECQA